MPDYVTFNRMIHLLDPETIENTISISIRHRMAREKYNSPTGYTVTSWEDYMSKGIHYATYHHRTVHQNDPPEYVAWGDVLNAAKASRTTVEEDYPRCRRNLGGGILRTYDSIALVLRTEHEQNYKMAKLMAMDPADYDHIREVMEAYYQRFARHLPIELRAIDALVDKWEDVLLNHAEFISTMRLQIGKP